MISIVIPALNEEKFISACLRSLKNQSYDGEYEIIVVNNGSTDKTGEIARAAGAIVLSYPEKKNVFYARQKGADAAKGDIIVQADADTTYPEDWLKRIAEQFAAHPRAVAVAGRFLYDKPPFWARIEYLLRHLTNLLTVFFAGRPIIISGATFAFRRQAFLAGNGYRDITYAPDQYGIASRLSNQGKIIYDSRIHVFTSPRRVQKSVFKVLWDLTVHLRGWGMYLLGCWWGSTPRLTARIRAKRLATWLLPIPVLVLCFLAYGYFVPASPVFGKVYYKVNSSEKVVALTFDDSPNEPYTPQILDILDRYNVKATFFVVGQNLQAYPEIGQRILAEGNVVGNHSYSHSANHALTTFGSRDMGLAQMVIFSVLGVTPHLYRPPHGKKTPWELAAVKKEGLIEVTWSVATGELRARSATSVARNIIGQTDPGEIILLHDGYGASRNFSRFDGNVIITALPLIIEGLEAKGYRFVTVPELLNVPAYNE